MGDREMVATPTTMHMGYSAVPNNSASYGDGSPRTIHEAGVAGAAVFDVEFYSSGQASFFSTTRVGNLAPDAVYARQGISGQNSALAVASKADTHNSFANGTVADQSIANENGNYSPDADAAAAEQILEDASAPG